MKVQQEIPERAEVELEALVKALCQPADSLEPFAEPTIEFCAAFSRALFEDAQARRFPAVVALAHHLRKAELLRLRREFTALGSPETVLVPRGLVFHVPPANVDTMFIFSWLFSFLVGNRNVIRLPTRISAPVEAICQVFRRTTAAADESLHRNTVMLRYGHETEITAALSAIADLRVIWGGDATVSTIRSIPLSAQARELAFADRYSLCVIRASAWLALDGPGRTRLAESFFNDAYWFDQAACSSPRLVVWCGSPDDTRQAAKEFFGALRAIVDTRDYRIDTGAALAKLTFAHRAVLDQPVSGYQALGNEVSILEISALADLDREHCGAGLFFQYQASGLEELVPFVQRKDQTLTHFGFDAAELRHLALSLSGRGLDRLVPVGQALAFDRYWDGQDLLREMTRMVVVRVASAGVRPE